MLTNISITYCESGYNWCTNVLLVRGVGRKTVRVILRPFNGYADETQVALAAAKLATQKGWRKIVVAPDYFEGNTLRGFNLHQYYAEQWRKIRIGIFLGFLYKK